jgi:hypothetical protein
MLDIVKHGRWRGGPAPFGYRSVSRGTLNFKGKPILDVEIDPENAEHIKTIFRLYTREHYGTRLIARYLNDREIKMPEGGLWPAGDICRILRQRLYTGIYELHKSHYSKNKDKVESPVMPHLVIIDGDAWNKAQERLSGNRVHQTQKTVHGALLTGLLYCGQCGNRITTYNSYYPHDRKKPIEQRRKQYSYRCVNADKPRTKAERCKPAMWKQERMNETVIGFAKQFILQVDKDRLIAEQESGVSGRIAESIKRLDGTEAEVEKNAKDIKNLKAEIMKALSGESSFTQDTLSEMLKEKELEAAALTEKHERAQQEIILLRAGIIHSKKRLPRP